MMKPTVADPNRRTSVSTVRDRPSDRAMVFVWVVVVPLVSAAGWAGVAWAVGAVARLVR